MVEFKWHQGDKLIVTGDSSSWKHGFARGTEVEVLNLFPWNGDPGYTVRHTERDTIYNVCEQDLRETIPPVTDAELAEVYRSLGVQ